MKKNTMMRLASALLVLVMLTTCAISGTFAKYVTTAGSEDAARVAYWGFQTTKSMDLDDLFVATYDGDGDKSVNAQNGDDVIAPGTTRSTTFAFAFDEKASANGSEVSFTGPEVAYEFKVEVDSEIDPRLVANTNIQWKLDDGQWGTFADMVNAIKALSGDASGTKTYAPNTLPTAFATTDTVHTIAWQWIFSTSEAMEEMDTDLGNALTDDTLAEVSIRIDITATQVDEFAAPTNP